MRGPSDGRPHCGHKHGQFGLLATDPYVASLERVLARVVAVLQEYPVRADANSTSPHVDPIEERARAIDGRLTVDARLGGAVAHDGKHVDRLDVHGLGGTVILVFLLA